MIWVAQPRTGQAALFEPGAGSRSRSGWPAALGLESHLDCHVVLHASQTLSLPVGPVLEALLNRLVDLRRIGEQIWCRILIVDLRDRLVLVLIW